MTMSHEHDTLAVVYARFSCSKQREASIDDQVRECSDFAARNGYDILRVYSDYAMSGKTDDRPAFQEMIANAGESEAVIVYMMDRFSRDPFDAPIYKRELERKGVRLVSAMESIPDSPEGIIYEKLLEGLAACESAKTSARARRGMHGNALKCMHNGVKVFGYDFGGDGHYAVNEEQADIVREAFQRRIEGQSPFTIAKELRARGVRTTFGSPASDTFVRNMLRNRKYLGEYRFGDVVVPGGMPAIVDDATFHAATATKARKDRSMQDFSRYLLTGKAVCGKCGHDMQGASGHGRNGTKHEYYRCHDGHVKPVRRDWLEESVAGAVERELSGRKEAERIAAMVVEAVGGIEHEGKLKRLKSSLRECDKAISSILDAIEDGFYTPLMKDRMRELEAKKAHIERDIAMQEAVENPTVEDMADFLQWGATLGREQMLEAFVSHVIVTDDLVTVVLAYDGDGKNEPARLELVRTSNLWLPSHEGVRTDGEFLLITFPRAA